MSKAMKIGSVWRFANGKGYGGDNKMDEYTTEGLEFLAEKIRNREPFRIVLFPNTSTHPNSPDVNVCVDEVDESRGRDRGHSRGSHDRGGGVW